MRNIKSHQQYYKIDLIFIIKLQERNLNACQEYETEREAQGPNRTQRDKNVPAERADFFIYIQIFNILG